MWPLGLQTRGEQQPAAPATTPAPDPFVNPRAIPGSPSAARLRVWAAAVYQHQPGDADQAAASIGKWSQADLSGILAALDGIRKALASGTAAGIVHIGDWTTTTAQLREMVALTPAEMLSGDVSRLLKRGAILHTDLASAVTRGPGPSATPDLASLQLGMAMELVDALRAPAGAAAETQATGPASWRSTADGAFIHAWYLAVAALLQSVGDIDSGPRLLDRAVALFPGEPRLLLMAGGAAELLASSHAQQGDVKDRGSVGTRDANVKKAEACYRQALAADETMLEAKLRLARDLGLQGRHKEALAGLLAAAADGAPSELRYFRFLFLGDEQAALGNQTAARQAYTRALELYPGAPSALAAIAALDSRRGRTDAAPLPARDVVVPSAGDALDPWATYFVAGDGRRAQQVLDELRAPWRRR